MPSFDGTPIAVHFFPADGLKAGARAPLVMLAHGYAERGPASRDTVLAGMPSVDRVLKAGYNVLTWDARGHGDSGGTADFDNPDAEGRDTRALIDWAATQPEVQLDAPGDPRVGMAGASYGGIIQFTTAGLDHRVDVIEPAYTGHALADDVIAPHGKFKEGWGLFLAVATAQTLPHTPSPASIDGLLGGVASGRLADSFRVFLDHRSPSRFVGRVRVPTLLQEGTSDTLFPLVNAQRNFEVLERAGVPVKIAWNCEGHSACAASNGAPGYFDETAIRWFDRWLRADPGVDTGPPFEWIADNETQRRSAAMFPPQETGRLTKTGSGSLALSPLSAASSTGFVLVGGAPAAPAVDVEIPAPATAADVVGFPSVKLTYSGTATPASTWLYGQVVDRTTGRVVGGQVIPIAVTLDGAEHTVEQDLNAIATRGTPGSRYRVQIFGGSLIFGQQRSVGSVGLTPVEASLPMIDATAGPRLVVGRPRLLRAGGARVRIEALREGFRAVRVTLERRTAKGRWQRVSRTGARDVSVGATKLTFRRKLRPGLYRASVSATDPYGQLTRQTSARVRRSR